MTKFDKIRQTKIKITKISKDSTYKAKFVKKVQQTVYFSFTQNRETFRETFLKNKGFKQY